MSTPPLDRYAEHFQRLADMLAEDRESALAELPLADAERALLRRMLDADGDAADPLALALGGAARAELAALAPRDQLGPYRLGRELGAGGMGTVFLAERVDGGFTQQVAIKLLRGFPTSEGLRRLRLERQILAGLDHPHIARLLDGGESDDGQPWLALEHVDGWPLLDYCARKAPRLQQRLALFDAVLDAVGHAHQRLVVHRDIKPSNVMVDRRGQVKLLDFGIARLVDLETRSGAAATSTRVFSAGHASPEQREGRAITTVSDIYSLGVLLGELLAVAEPQGKPDAELAGILAKACDPDPARRYASADAFRDDLDRYRDGRPVRAARLTRRYRARKFAARHRLGIAASLAALLALGVFVWRLDHERTRATQAELASARDAERAKASLQFLVDAFEAAAPEQALSRTVSVRDLLDKAGARVDDTPMDPTVARPIQRMLGRLFDSLGDHQMAIERFRRGLDGVKPQERDQALEIALDLDQYANLLGIVDRNDEARLAIDEARGLRQRFAPDDPVQQARNAFSLAVWHHNAGENAKAIRLFRQALAMSPSDSELPLDLAVRASAFLSSALVKAGSCGEAVAIADRGLQRLAGGDVAAPRRLWLMRNRASALRACGRPAEAESVLRELVELQRRNVGEDGMGMLQLTNELTLALKDQGRFREASALMQAARIPDGIGPYNRAVLM
ncbi:MAG TPA: serine/threonine-protein kinase, partial [Rhodanobacteraceae bacterium]|nr:serine/threonine-protein kinase [Rhodanobacteraceae bacterium]